MKIKHRKRFHFQSPITLPSIERKGETYWKCKFTEDSKYDIGTDQSDWNKLCGGKQDFLKPMSNSIMTGWRYYNNKFEVAPYYHINNERFLPVEWIEIPINTEFTTGLFRENRKMFWVCNDVKVELNVPTGIWQNPWWEITSWFGGNRTANVSFEKTKL
jgi:hypothetical protein